MTKFVAAGLPAGVVVCAFLSVASASAQDSGANSDATAAEPTTSSADGTPLPKVVVTTPKEKKKKSAAKTAPGKAGGGGSSDGGATGQAAQQDAGGVGGGVDSEAKVDGVVLGGPAVSDTGTTKYDSHNVRARSLGGGDANTFVRNAPNVQYQDQTSTDAGTNPYREIDTKPMEFSINGGRTYQNNIVMNGVSINNVVGPIESSDPQLDEDGIPLFDVLYGVHSQTVYVPVEFLDSATIIDSNASAKYGDFLGGVVLYDLASPPTDRWRGSVKYDRHTDSMVHYKIGTENGTNPLSRKAPEFTKDNVAVSLGGPITTDFAIIGQYSGKFAETKKQKDYEFFDKMVGMESSNDFFRVAASLKTEYGRFKLETSITDYMQTWESESFRDLFLNVENTAQTTQLEYKNELPSLDYAGLGIAGVSVKARAFYNDSESANVSSGDTAWYWVGMQRRKGRNDPPSAWTTVFDAAMTDDYCRALPIEALGLTASQDNTACREGGWGSLYQGQEDLGAQAELTGDLLWGRFLVGGEAKKIEGTRERPRDFTVYSSFNTLFNTPTVSEFICPAGDEACTSEQYARIWTVQPAFDISAEVETVNLFAEIDQTFGWLNVRAGVRFDYEDYFANPNFAPRLVGTLMPFDWFSISGGYNRYYDGASLYYAIRDAQPRSITNTRIAEIGNTTVHDADGNVSENVRIINNAPFAYRSAGLDTPYKDEYTAAIRIKEPLFGGHFRVRYLERYGKDEFSRDNCEVVNTLCNVLSNDGESFYRSWTGEYTTFWKNPESTILSSVGLTGSITWSEQTTNRGTYFDGDGSEEYILYHEQRYTRENFVAVTGNLDIPIRIGALLTTNWFNNRVGFDINVGFDFGYDGVYDTDVNQIIEGLTYNVFDDRTFKDTLVVDLTGHVMLTENAAIEIQVNNLTDSIGNKIASNANPWVRGRSYWVGSSLRF